MTTTKTGRISLTIRDLDAMTIAQLGAVEQDERYTEMTRDAAYATAEKMRRRAAYAA